MKKLIWTHESDFYDVEKRWTAMRVEAGENPFDRIAQLGEHAGQQYGETELEAVFNLLEVECLEQ